LNIYIWFISEINLAVTMCASEKCFLLQQLLVVILFEIYGIDDSAFIAIVFFGYCKCKFLVLYLNTLVNHL